MTNFKKIFLINKFLMKHEMPEDLVPTFFYYLGDTDETAIDLENKHCFYAAKYDDATYNKNVLFGHYCTYCDKLYLLYSNAQLKQHSRSKYHQKMLLNKMRPITRVSIPHLQTMFIQKHYKYWWKPPSWREKALNSLTLKKITVNSI